MPNDVRTAPQSNILRNKLHNPDFRPVDIKNIHVTDTKNLYIAIYAIHTTNC